MSIVRFIKAVLIIAKVLVVILTTNHMVYDTNPDLLNAYLTSGNISSVFHALNI